MNIDLPADVVKGLPDPASDDGLIRVTAGLRKDADGKFDLVELNDSPLPGDAEDVTAPRDELETSEQERQVYDL